MTKLGTRRHQLVHDAHGVFGALIDEPEQPAQDEGVYDDKGQELRAQL
jgi:hypothetical protein